MRVWTPLLALATAFAVPLAAQAYPIKPPWRGDSLPHDAYMMTEGHGDDYNCPNGAGEGCGIDLRAQRHNGSQWTQMKTVASGSPIPFTDYLSFGMQLYSPVDGEVIACWQNMPEEDLDGSAPDPCEDPADPESLTKDLCSISGNHLLIRTFDGHVVYLAHLKLGSIEPGLCPITDVALMGGDEDKICGMSNRIGILNDARIDLRSPFPGFPAVRKGDPVAKVGNSGGSTTPHLHMGVYSYAVDELGNPCIAGVPWEFAESWSQPRPSGDVVATDWDPLDGDELLFDGTWYALWGDPLGPNVDELPVDVGSLPAVAVTPSGGVGVFKNASDELEAVGFTFNSLGAFDLGTPSPDTIAVVDLDVARLNATDRHVIAAVSDADTDLLTIVPYFVEADADLIVGTKRVELTATGTTLVRATPSPNHNGIVVATRNSANKMTLNNYKSTLAGTNISVTRQSTAATNDVISDLDIATVVAGRGLSEFSGAFKGVVTVERRTSNNTWWLRSWQINALGTSLVGVDTEQVLTMPGGASIAVTDVDVTVVGGLPGREFIVTSAITGGNLRVQAWQITTAGVLSPIDEYSGGGPLLQLSSTRSGLQDVVVGARFSGNLHTLMSFHVSPSGALRRVGTWDSDTLSSLAIAGRTAQNDLVAMFTEVLSGDVTLDHYVTNYSSGL